MIVYYKLFDLLNRKGIKKSELVKKKIIFSNTLSSLSKNENVNMCVIDKLCEFLQCQPSDIMEYVNVPSEKKIKKSHVSNDNGNKESVCILGKNYSLDYICKLSENIGMQLKLEMEIGVDDSNHVIEQAKIITKKRKEKAQKEREELRRKLLDNEYMENDS